MHAEGEHARALSKARQAYDCYVQKPGRGCRAPPCCRSRWHYSVPCELAEQMVSTTLYPGVVVVIATNAVIARTSASATRDASALRKARQPRRRTLLFVYKLLKRSLRQGNHSFINGVTGVDCRQAVRLSCGRFAEGLQASALNPKLCGFFVALTTTWRHRPLQPWRGASTSTRRRSSRTTRQ